MKLSDRGRLKHRRAFGEERKAQVALALRSLLVAVSLFRRFGQNEKQARHEIDRELKSPVVSPRAEQRRIACALIAQHKRRVEPFQSRVRQLTPTCAQ